MRQQFPFDLKSIQGSLANNARGYDKLGRGNDDLAYGDENAPASLAIPDTDISASCGLCDRNVHIKSWHAIGVEILHHSLPNQKLSGQTTPLSGLRQLNSSQYRPIRSRVAFLPHCTEVEQVR